MSFQIPARKKSHTYRQRSFFNLLTFASSSERATNDGIKRKRAHGGGNKVRRIRIRTLQGIEVTLLELAPERLELLG